MSAANDLSFAELQAAKAAALAAAVAKRDGAVAEAERAASRARDAHEQEAATLQAAHDSELVERSAKSAKMAHLRLAPLWKERGSREAAVAFAAEVRRVASETRRLIGEPYAPLGPARAVIGNRLWIVAAAACVKDDPAALPIFASETCGLDVLPGLGVQAVERLTSLCLDPQSTPGELLDAMNGLEDAIGRTARNGNRATRTDDADRFELYRSHAARESIEAGLAALKTAELQRLAEAGEKHRGDVMKARMGLDDPSWAPGWASEMRRVMGRLVTRADGAIRREGGGFST